MASANNRSNQCNSNNILYTIEDDYLEIMESSEKETEGIAENWHGKRPCKSEGMYWWCERGEKISPYSFKNEK